MCVLCKQDTIHQMQEACGVLAINWSHGQLGRILASHVPRNDDHRIYPQCLDSFGHQLLTATCLEKGPKGHGILQRGFHFSILNQFTQLPTQLKLFHHVVLPHTSAMQPHSDYQRQIKQDQVIKLIIRSEFSLII